MRVIEDYGYFGIFLASFNATFIALILNDDNTKSFQEFKDIFHEIAFLK